VENRTRYWVIFVVLLFLVGCSAFGIKAEVVGLASPSSSTSEPTTTATTNPPFGEPQPLGEPQETQTTPITPPTYSIPPTPPASNPVAPPSTTTIPGPTSSHPGAPLVISQGDDAVSYQMTPGHNGYSPDRVGPTWQRSWTKNLGGSLSYPLIAGGQIYVVSQEDGGLLLSINAATGRINWQVDAGTSVGIAYSNGDIFSVSGGGVTTAYGAANGGRLWSTALPGQSEFYPPAAAGGMVYVGAAGSGGTVYGIDASQGRLVWTGQVENGNTSIPTITSSGVFVSYACQQTYDFDPRTGVRLWHHSTSCEGGGGATAVSDGPYLLVEDVVTGDVVLSTSSGSVVRSFKSANPAFNGGQLTPATDGGDMFVLDGGSLNEEGVASGLVGWSFAGDGNLETSPIVVDKTVYEGSSSGMLYAVSATSGRQEWDTDVGAPVGPNIVEGDHYLIVPTTAGLTVFTPS